jgi:cytochrome c553
MKLTSAAALLGLGLLVATPAFAAPGVTEGQGIYETRCKMCHANAVNNAPPLEKIQADITDPQAIIEKLTTGTMMAMASGLSDGEKTDIAMFLTGKSLPAPSDPSAAPPAPPAEPAPAPAAPQ